MQRTLVAILIVSVACFSLVSCNNQQQAGPGYAVEPIRPPKPVPPAPPKVYAYAPNNLQFLGLEQVWVSPLNDPDAPTVRDAYLMGNYVIVETNTKKLYGFDRKSSAPLFAYTLADPTDVRCCEDDDCVYAIARDVLYAIDKRAFLAWKKYLDLPASSQMIADENNIYVGCVDAKVRAFRKSLKYIDWTYTTGRIVTARPAMGTRLLYAASQDNYVYALSPDDGKEQWKFKTLGPIRANPVYSTADHRLYVASTDGNLYCLYDLAQGSREAQMAWLAPYTCGAPIIKTPVVAGGVAYIFNENGECHAVDAMSGKGKWFIKNVTGFAARGETSTYLVRGTSILSVDTATGNVRWILDTANVAPINIMANSVDGGIYLVRADGATILVRERQPQSMPEAKPAEAPAAVVAPAPKAPAKAAVAPADK